MAKRFYHIAFGLGVTPRQFIRELGHRGLSVGSQMVVVPETLEQRIREIHEQMREPRPHPAEETGERHDSTAIGEAPMPLEAEEAPIEELLPAASQVEAPPEDVSVEPVPSATVSAAGTAAPAPAPPRARLPRRRPGEAPAVSSLVPTLDPRAGRLVKDAPRAGVPGVTAATRGRGPAAAPPEMNPLLPASQRAPGARRDSHRRATVPEEFRGKQGKETFHLRKRSTAKSRVEPIVTKPKSFEVEPPVSVKRFSEISGLKSSEVVKTLFVNHNLVLNPNSMLDQSALEILALELELEIKFTKTATAEDKLLERVGKTDAPEHLVSRPPVVTILGHVDHGKTTLLDKIRSTDIAAKEAGGITQHIGASQVKLPDGRKVTFIDTPGHEAFTEMRARGAKVTDVVVLVVDGVDGAMPQTVEAISHARAAGVPIIVAITKCDKPAADPRKVKQQLAENGVFVEGYGGDVSCFEVSALTGKGVAELLEHLALLVEVDAERFRSNPDRPAEGTVIEAENSPQRGIVATILVRNGTLRKGDPILAGEAWGTVRALFDYLGRQVPEAGPGDPVEMVGLDQAPEAGSKFYVLDGANHAREMAEERRMKSREKELASQSKPTTVETLLGAIDQGKVKELRVVLKADVKGSLEPIKLLLNRMGTDEVRVKVLHAAAGAVNESDVILASASNAWVIGFSTNVDEKARAKAKMLGVSVQTYKIVYEIEDVVRAALEGKLAPEIRDTVTGHAEVLKLFASSRLGTIAGCRVRDGIIRRDSWARILRGTQSLFEGRLASLRREKDEAREVKEGLECGLRVEGWDGWRPGDVVEAFTREEIARKLA